jgi:hypothetical protein
MALKCVGRDAPGTAAGAEAGATGRSTEAQIETEAQTGAVARAWPEPLAMHRLPEPERRFYPPEPVCARLPGGPGGFRSCLDRA